MNRYILILLCLSTIDLVAQVDYNEFKNRNPLTCCKHDSLSVIQSQHLLDSLGQYEIINGRQQYLYEHGWVYYARYGKWSDEDDLKKALMYFKKNWETYQDLGSLWSLTLYSRLNECNKAIEYTELYIKQAKKDSVEIDYKQIYYVYKRCYNNQK